MGVKSLGLVAFKTNSFPAPSGKWPYRVNGVGGFPPDNQFCGF
jgi:hypothetical protein